MPNQQFTRLEVPTNTEAYERLIYGDFGSAVSIAPVASRCSRAQLKSRNVGADKGLPRLGPDSLDDLTTPALQYGSAETERSVDESDMRERLREVAHHPARRDMIFLGHQPNIVGDAERALE